MVKRVIAHNAKVQEISSSVQNDVRHTQKTLNTGKRLARSTVVGLQGGQGCGERNSVITKKVNSKPRAVASSLETSSRYTVRELDTLLRENRRMTDDVVAMLANPPM